jgi:chromosome segregation ATPase
LIVAIAAIIVLSWFVWSFNSLLNETKLSLTDAQDRIEALESRQRQTEGNLTDSGTTTQEALKFWEDETRKIYDYVHKTNKPSIAENKEDIAELGARIEGFNTSISDLENSITLSVSQQRDLTDKLNTHIQTTSSRLDGLDTKVRRSEEAIDAIDKSRMQNNNRLLELDNRVRDLEMNN